MTQDELKEIHGEFTDSFWTMLEDGTLTLMSDEFTPAPEGSEAPSVIDIVNTREGFDVIPVDVAGKEKGLSKDETINYILDTFL